MFVFESKMADDQVFQCQVCSLLSYSLQELLDHNWQNAIVLSQAVLDLLTWQELERRVCSDPELTVEALKKCNDRSRFLRFVTGRRRLPAPLYICPGRSSIKIDSLPEAATCSSTLFLPEYSSAKVAEEKIRYAAYNCLAIDTDVSPWEE